MLSLPTVYWPVNEDRRNRGCSHLHLLTQREERAVAVVDVYEWVQSLCGVWKGLLQATARRMAIRLTLIFSAYHTSELDSMKEELVRSFDLWMALLL